MRCAELATDHRQPALRGAVRAHLESCDECAREYGPFFIALRDAVVSAEEQFVPCVNAYVDFSDALAAACETPAKVDAPRHIAGVLCRQVHNEFAQYYRDHPDDNIVALCWLQKVFVLCRVFGSEDLIERATPFKLGKPFVGRLPVPSQPAYRGTGSFATATSLLRFPGSGSDFGLPVFNPLLQAHIEAEVSAKQYVHALTLICDSTKHGVLSPLINLSATAHPEFAYSLGLMAAADAIRAYLTAVLPAHSPKA